MGFQDIFQILLKVAIVTMIQENYSITTNMKNTRLNILNAVMCVSCHLVIKLNYTRIKQQTMSENKKALANSKTKIVKTY